jgi:predicted transcriptional regulator
LNKREQALIKASTELGKSSYQIEKETGIAHTTVGRYLKNQEAYADPKMKEMVAQIKEHEILDLTVLNVRAKARLHKIADRMNPIEAIALMDRTFQQIRLVEGKSTQNIASLTKIIQDAHGDSNGGDNREAFK